jgi:hypothetical protein
MYQYIIGMYRLVQTFSKGFVQGVRFPDGTGIVTPVTVTVTPVTVAQPDPAV